MLVPGSEQDGHILRKEYKEYVEGDKYKGLPVDQARYNINLIRGVAVSSPDFTPRRHSDSTISHCCRTNTQWRTSARSDCSDEKMFVR